jgi:hypothetical protein
MRKMPFFAPVCVSSPDDAAGKDPNDIADIEQALQFLRRWPPDRRGPVYQAAYNACTAAREGYLTVEEARKSFSGFARITGILRNDVPRPSARRARKEVPREVPKHVH